MARLPTHVRSRFAQTNDVAALAQSTRNAAFHQKLHAQLLTALYYTFDTFSTTNGKD